MTGVRPLTRPEGTRASIARLAYQVEGWGIGELWLAGDVVVAHESPRRKETWQGSDPCHVLIERVRAYFAGARESFADVDLDLEWCTPFQRDVAAALRTVPYGEVVSYGELAALAGHPRAHRAAASFCAQNRHSLFLPCHRVVAAEGLGGYGSLGLGYKRRLLALERVAL